MNYNLVLWLSGFLAGAGVATVIGVIGSRLLPLRIKILLQAEEPSQDPSEKWKEGEG